MLLCPEPFSISLAPAEYKNIHIHIFHYGLSWVNWAILITKQYEYILLERVTERSVKVKVTCIQMMIIEIIMLKDPILMSAMTIGNQ